MDAEPSDELLMRQATAGSVEAFGVLFDRYQPRLLAFLTRLLGDRSSAEDAVQEAFWRAWEYRETFNVTSRFSSWLYVIARNTALTERRREGRQPERVSSLREDDLYRFETAPSPPGSEPHRVVEGRTVRECVREALMALPRDQRLCLVLREYEGLSHRETAEVMGCSEASVRVIAFRARKALARSLKGLLQSEDCRVG